MVGNFTAPAPTPAPTLAPGWEYADCPSTSDLAWVCHGYTSRSGCMNSCRDLGNCTGMSQGYQCCHAGLAADWGATSNSTCLHKSGDAVSVDPATVEPPRAATTTPEPAEPVEPTT